MTERKCGLAAMGSIDGLGATIPSGIGFLEYKCRARPSGLVNDFLCMTHTVPCFWLCDLEQDFLRFGLYTSTVKLPFRPNWLLRLLALLAVTVSGGALANQYFLRLEQAPKLAKPHDNKQIPAKPTAALFEHKKLEQPIFADLVSGPNSDRKSVV